MSKSGRKKGSIPWNKGIPMSEESKRKVSESKKGTPAWNKGMEMPEVSERMKGNQNGSGGKGKIISLETRLKMRAAKLGKPSPRRGAILSEEQKDRLRTYRIGMVASDSSKEKNRQSQYERYIKMNPDYKVETRNKRIALNGGFHSEKEWNDLKERYNFACANPECSAREPEIRLTRDHILPILLGGRNDISNIQPLCNQCNRKKHVKTIRY